MRLPLLKNLREWDGSSDGCEEGVEVGLFVGCYQQE